MSSATVSSAIATGMIRLPVYEPLPASLCKGVADAASAILSSESVEGDLFNMSRASKVPIGEVQSDAIILVPLFCLDENIVITSDDLAGGPMMYIKLDGPPQPRAVFGTCIAFSEGAEERIVGIGGRVHFPPPLHFLVAKSTLVDLFDPVSGTATDNPRTREDRVAKRLCIRLPETEGELAESKNLEVPIEKGTTKYILDLDGYKHLTRNKTDIAQREKELWFAFRTVDKDRWEYVMGSDLTLQPAEYRYTVIQQARLRSDHRHEAFTSCGYLDRIQDLEFTQKSDRLKLLLTGQIMAEGETATLTLDDFAGGEILSTCCTVCPNQNRPLVVILKNLQTSLEVFLSSEFEGVFDQFIADLEGVDRPMELVAADFLKYSVEQNLRKFFRAVSSQRASRIFLEWPLSNPEDCSLYLGSLFNTLSMDLSDHHSRAVEIEYFRMHQIRDSRAAKLSTPKRENTSSSSSTSVATSNSKKDAPTKTCAGHFGSQLKAFYSDGRPYSCAFGKACKFKHVRKIGKTNQEVQAIIASLPATARDDLGKVVKKTA